jgi:hypothetical protein
MRYLTAFLAGCVLAAGASRDAGSAAAESTVRTDGAALTITQFQRLHGLIKPHEQREGWRSIPWMTDLHEARKKAAAEGKMLFVWAIAGEPLGSA